MKVSFENVHFYEVKLKVSFESPGEPRRGQQSSGEPLRGQQSPGEPRRGQQSPGEPRRAQESPAESRGAQGNPAQASPENVSFYEVKLPFSFGNAHF